MRKHNREKAGARVLLSRPQYLSLKRQLYIAQRGLCAHCGQAESLELHHLRRRGMDGAWRDDARSVLLCRSCHERAAA
jgi:5-methylcytosine-specific restriction endonuclease McrA